MRRLKVLNVEENQNDARLLVRACQAAGLSAEFLHVRNGREAIDYLQGRGGFTNRMHHPLPDVIVLSMDSDRQGIEFLQWLRREPKLNSMPVLAFSKSTNVEDRMRAIDEGATGYFVKPKESETLARFAEFLRRLNGNGANKNEPAA